MVMPTISKRTIESSSNDLTKDHDILRKEETFVSSEDSSIPPSKKIKMFNSHKTNDDILDQISREVQSISEWENLLQTWDSEKENLPFEPIAATIPAV
mmetsp:Transcript_15997/g.24217  ORF Transcript_15997/g.24217 Transcript_15997/m.24217 type:complete len:98 (+) Transcript_15997:117-410(+)